MNQKEKDLHRKTRSKLLNLAIDAKVLDCRQMSKAQLIVALMAINTQPEPPSPPPIIEDELDADDLVKIERSSTAALKAILADPELRGAKRAAVEAQILEREERDRLAQEAAARVTTDVVQYTVTKGGPFIIDGHMTQLPNGSVLSHLTHDLDAVRAQGITLEVCKGVRVDRDQLGNQISYGMV